MRLVKKDFVCPYCFSKQDFYKIQFRCQNHKCKYELDDNHDAFRDLYDTPGTPSTRKKLNVAFEIPRPKNFIDTLKFFQLPKKAKCPHCNEFSSIRICPSCHSELPYTLGDYKDVVFSLIGAKESGKSHYISVLINTIENQISRLFNAHLQKLGDNTIAKYRNEFYNPIFENKEVIPETRTARSNYNVKLPMVFVLSFIKKNIFGKTRKKKTNVTTISFFDTAGEDLNAQETMRTENKYIYNSSGIILLVDPLQLKEVRSQLTSRGVKLPKINTETDDIITRVVKLIRTALEIPAEELIDIPIAVAFSKIDALDVLLDSGSSFFSSGKHEGYYNLSDSINVNTEVENLMNEWAGFHLIQGIKHNFKDYSFFGLSALGSNPHGSIKIPKLRPLRVEDPFLWLLYKNNIIKGK